MSGEGKPVDLERALLDPAAVFPTPEAVIAQESLTPDQKVEILRRWDYDARELDVAEDEGMLDGEASLLDRIEKAIHALGYDVEHRGSPPTRQGGIAADKLRKAPSGN